MKYRGWLYMTEQYTKMLVPELRFPEFQNAAEWEVQRIGQISENVTAGGTPSTSEKDYWGGTIRWMNSGELNYKIVHEVQGRITEKGLRNSSTKIIPKLCVLIGLAGQGKTRGTVAINMIELCINQSIAAIFPNEQKFSSEFLYHNLDNRYDELRSLSTGGEGRGGLNLQIIKSLGVPLPGLKEQQKIADCFSSIDKLITVQTNKIEALQEHKKGLLQQLFPAKGETVPKLRFPEFQDAEEWEEKKLGECLDYQQPTPYLVSDTNYSDAFKTPVLTAGKTFILGYTNEQNGIFNDNLPVIIFDDFTTATQFVDFPFKAKSSAMKILLAKSGASIKFMYELMQMIAYEVGTHERHWISKFALMTVLIPSPDEQKKIADCLSSMDNLIKAQIQKLEGYKTLKKGLIQQLFPNIDEVSE